MKGPPVSVEWSVTREANLVFPTKGTIAFSKTTAASGSLKSGAISLRRCLWASDEGLGQGSEAQGHR